MKVGDHQQVKAVASDAAGQDVNSIPLSWTVSDPTIATVSADGVVTALKTGRVTLTASFGTVQSNSVVIDVVVVPPPPAVLTSIKLTAASPSILVGTNEEIKATDQNSVPLSGLIWISSNTAVATVDANGKVSALQAGTTTITASSGAITSDPFELKVETPPPPPPPGPHLTAIKLFGASPSILVGSQEQFQATDQDGAPLSGLTWTSNNTAVATIDANGIVSGLKEGSAQITASSGTVISEPFALIVSAPPPPTPPGQNQPPVARVTPAPLTGAAPLLVTFDGSASADPDGTIVSYAWDFRDGSIGGNSPTVAHIYSKAGVYKAELVVTDNLGLTQGTVVTITVTPAPPAPTPVHGSGWQRSGVNGDLFGVAFASQTEGWVVGMNQAIAHTTDGGATWTPQTITFRTDAGTPISPPTNEVLVDFYDVFFLDATTGWAVGWPEAIFKTIDGGATWTEQHLNRVYWSPTAMDPKNHTWCEPGYWNADTGTCSKKRGVYLRRVKFSDPQNGWVVGRNGFIFHTTDATNWKFVTPPINPFDCSNPRIYPYRKFGDYTPHWFGLDTQSNTEIWISGGSDNGDWCQGWNRVIIHSVDGGATWTLQNDHPNYGALQGNGRYQDIRLLGNLGWAVGEIGTVIRTVDHGVNWSRVRIDQIGATTLWGLAFVDPQHIWITGAHGLAVNSPDGGANWIKQVIPGSTQPQLRHSFFLDANQGWIASQDEIFLTTSGGN